MWICLPLGFSSSLCAGRIRFERARGNFLCQAAHFSSFRFRCSDSFCLRSTIRSLSSCWRRRSIFSWVWWMVSWFSSTIPCVSSWCSRCATMSKSWRINESSPLDKGSFGIGIDGVEILCGFAFGSSSLEFLDKMLNQSIGWWCSYEWCHMR